MECRPAIHRRTAALVALLSLGALAGCHAKSEPCKPGGDGSYTQAPYSTLAEYCMVELTDGGIAALPGVMPYDLNTPLFTDYAVKTRTVWMPAGQPANYSADGVLDFPDGTVITKSFGMRDDLRKAVPIVHWMETRVLIKAAGAWQPYTYRWNDAQTEATLDNAGAVVLVPLIGEDGGSLTSDYLVPTPAQCLLCHANDSVASPIGPKARQLNKDYAYADGGANQLERWTQAGFLSGAPDAGDAPRLAVWNDPTTGTLEQRARAYLEGNCAHCHNPDGAASDGGLVLWASETDPAQVGICKAPFANSISAGYTADIMPGSPEQSFLLYRLASTEGGVMMPPVSRSLTDEEGVALVSSWIASLDGGCP